MISSVRLQNFRGYTDATFEFKNNTNVIVGPNGVGKTTILEAIYATLRGSSWRGGDEVVIRHGQDWARVDVATESDDTYSLLLDNRGDKLLKSRLLNGEDTSGPWPPVVLFEPDFIRTLTGPPDLRRSWIDDVIAQQDPSYNRTLKNYKRALFQRNRLLKQPRVADDHLFVWNLKLSEFGSIVSQTRAAFVEQLQPGVRDHYQHISASDVTIELVYQPQFTLHMYSTQHLHQLEQDLHKDHQRGFTSSGPHREDVLIKIRDKPITEEASRGEIKTIALSLKLAELDLIKEKNPIILSDELFEELDDERRRAIKKIKLHNHIATSIKGAKGTSHILKIDKITP